MVTVTMNISDIRLKERAEAALIRKGTTLDRVFQNLLQDIVENDCISDMPVFLSAPETLERDLRRAQEDRKNGVSYVPVEEVIVSLDRIIAEAEG